MTTNMQQRRPAAQPDASQDKTKVLTTALAKRLEQTPFLLPDVMRSALTMQGFREETINNIAACCLAVGVPPILLSHPHNLAPIQGLVADMLELGYRRGDDFHIAIYDNNQVTYNEFGEQGAKASLPTVVVMPTITRYEQNAKEDSRLDGIVFEVEAEIISDPEKAKEIFDRELGGTKSVWGPKVRVAEATLYKYLKSGVQIGSGKGQKFYGFFLPYKGNAQTEDYVEAGKVMANYSPNDIAIKRAKAKAYKAVSRAKMPRDNRSTADRLAMIAGQALQVIHEAQRDANEYGISINEAIVGDIPKQIEMEKAEVVKEAEKVVDAASFAAQSNARQDDFADLVAEEMGATVTTVSPLDVFVDDEQPRLTNLDLFFRSFREEMALDEDALGFMNMLSGLQMAGNATASSALITRVEAAIDQFNAWETKTVVVDSNTTSLPSLLMMMLCQASVDNKGKAQIKHDVAYFLAEALIQKKGNGSPNEFYDTTEMERARMYIKYASGIVQREFGQ